MRKSLCFTALVFWMTGTPASMAQDPQLFQAARKEGVVVWYTSLALPSSTAIAHAFKTKYTGMEVEVHRTGSQRVLQRVMQEASANIRNADVIHTSDAGHFELLKEKGMLLKHTPKGVEAFPAGFKDKDGFYYGMRATLSVIAHNPKAVPEKEAPGPWR
jgi:iron(III) transport system substrate-binding protein